MSKETVSRRWRTVALLAIGVAIGTTMTATPVYSHVSGSVTHLWNAHLKPKTDARYYTKTQANTRFALKGQNGGGNADLLDGLDSTDFLRATGKAADSDLLDGVDSAAFLRTTGKAADADLLDGLNSTAFLPTTGKAANANLLDGLDWTQLQQVCRTGSVHAVALIRGASNFSSTFVDVAESFTCWRGSGKVAARRISEGRYEVILSGAPYNSFCLSAPLVVGAIQNNSNDNNFFTYSSIPCGSPLETRIEVTNTSAASNFEDGLMTLAWYRILAPSAPG
ncbi:MAG TPA: hypothetical protein VD769_05965 [Gaiellaceae bacterium]|nr:hypothetical protein [Gaiellaceae bacterium]